MCRSGLDPVQTAVHLYLWETIWSVTQASGTYLDGNYQAGSFSLVYRCLFVGHFLQGAVVDPTAAGGLIDIDFSCVFKVTGGAGTCANSDDPALWMSPVLEQEGHYYLCTGQVVTQSQGETPVVFDSLAELDFYEVASNECSEIWDSHPDFSVAGPPIRLGYATGLTTDHDLCERDWGIDDLILGEIAVSTSMQSWSAVKAVY